MGAFSFGTGVWEWKPAVDLTRVIVGTQIVVVVAWLAIRSIAKARMKAAAASG